MSRRHVMTLLFLLSGSVLPVAVCAQQSDSKENQVQSPSTPQVQSPSTQVQPERAPQQSDQARRRDEKSAEGTRINPNWTTRQGGNDERAGMDHQQRIDRDRDSRTVGRNWHRDYDDMERGSRYGWADRDEDRYREARPRRRIKTCVEYENGDEFCRYQD